MLPLPGRSAGKRDTTFSCGVISPRFCSLNWSLALGLDFLPLETKYLFLRDIFRGPEGVVYHELLTT